MDHGQLSMVADKFQWVFSEPLFNACGTEAKFWVCPTFYTSGNSASCGPFSRKSATSKERYFIAW